MFRPDLKFIKPSVFTKYSEHRQLLSFLRGSGKPGERIPKYIPRRDLVIYARLSRLSDLLAAKAFDPFPFILLNLVLSCVAAIQAPLIMMSQNRQEEKDRRRAENDYRVNLKTEIMIEDLYDKVNAILARQSALEKHLAGQEKGTPKADGEK